MNPKLAELCKYKEQARKRKRQKSGRSGLLSLLMRSLSTPVGENLVRQFEAGEAEKFSEALSTWCNSVQSQFHGSK